MQNITAGLTRWLIKLVLAAFGLLFAASVVLASVVAVVVSLLKSLITWQKPAAFVLYSQFKQYRQQARGRRWPPDSRPLPTKDVVDVEVREVKAPADEKRLP